MSGVHRRRVKRPQRIFQLISAAFLNGYAVGFFKGKIFTGKSKAICVPVLNCYSCPGALGSCPVGALQTAVGGIKGRFPFYVLGSMMLFGVLLGRAVCGLLCPFGFLQDMLHKIPIPKLKNIKKLRILQKADRAARYIKYAVLIILVIVLPIISGISGEPQPWFCKFVCPAGTLEGGIPLLLLNKGLRQLVGALFNWKVSLLIIILLLSMTVHRPFCKYLCPLGAFYALFNKFSFYQQGIDREKCIGCKVCENACDMGIDVLKSINGTECIRCGKCREACPTGAIYEEFLPKKSNLKSPLDEAKL